MRYSILKKTEFKISKLGLGTNAVGGHNLYKNIDEQEGIALLEEALNQGINFIDTADGYGRGRSEELVGQVLKNKPRDSFVLATKGGQTSSGPNNTPSYMREAVEHSLHRLNMDDVDLYYVHFPDGKTPLTETIGELSRLKEEGKIKAIGVSNMSIEQLKEANSTGQISALQSPYHMLNRSAEKDLLPYCIDHDISFIPYGPLAFGILGGNYTKDFKLDDGDWRHKIPLFKQEHFATALDIVEQLKVIAANRGIELSNLALAWLLAQDGVDAVIPGGKRPEHVKRNMPSIEVTLTRDELQQIDAILNRF